MATKKTEPMTVCIPVKLCPTQKRDMDEAIFKLSKPGQIVRASEYIRQAVEDRNKAILNGKKK